jgi:hypothetical protein
LADLGICSPHHSALYLLVLSMFSHTLLHSRPYYSILSFASLLPPLPSLPVSLSPSLPPFISLSLIPCPSLSLPRIQGNIHLSRVELFLQEIGRREPLYFQQRAIDEKDSEYANDNYAEHYYKVCGGSIA